LARCLVYLDLNMVRAGVVSHPAQWAAGGYHEIQAAPRRYRIVDRAALAELVGLESVSQLPRVHAEWVETALQNRAPRRQPQWTESLAVGSRACAERVSSELGDRARYREVSAVEDAFVLREPAASYGASLAGGSGRIRPE
jgi:putative transposase